MFSTWRELTNSGQRKYETCWTAASNVCGLLYFRKFFSCRQVSHSSTYGLTATRLLFTLQASVMKGVYWIQRGQLHSSRELKTEHGKKVIWFTYLRKCSVFETILNRLLFPQWGNRLFTLWPLFWLFYGAFSTIHSFIHSVLACKIIEITVKYFSLIINQFALTCLHLCLLKLHSSGYVFFCEIVVHCWLMLPWYRLTLCVTLTLSLNYLFICTSFL